MNTFRAAVVGTGFIGPVHVEALRRAGVEVAAVVGSTPEKSRASSLALGVTGNHETLEDVLADQTIDAVHLATPNRFHFEQALAVLRSGKHVLCEKPLAMNSSESAQLVQFAKESGYAAGIAYNIRYYPLCHEAAARVRSGSLGEVLHAFGSYVQDWLLFDNDFNWRVLAEDGGDLRAIADIGTHWLDLVQFITGQHVVAVCADLRTIHSQRTKEIGSQETFSGSRGPANSAETVSIKTEDCGSVLLQFSNGANGCLWVSQATAGRKNCLRFEIGGSNQALAWNSESPNNLWIGHRDRANESLVRDPSLMDPASRSLCSYPGGHSEGFPDTFKQLFRSFYSYIEAGDFRTTPSFPTFADGHREILLCEAVLRSHRERRWVSIGE
jgi:predicted dehydrogenase